MDLPVCIAREDPYFLQENAITPVLPSNISSHNSRICRQERGFLACDSWASHLVGLRVCEALHNAAEAIIDGSNPVWIDLLASPEGVRRLWPAPAIRDDRDAARKPIFSRVIFLNGSLKFPSSPACRHARLIQG